jgi:hypothetical protein
MASTYSPDLRIELIGTGDQAGVWGNTTNDNLSNVLEASIAGYTAVSVIASNQALTANFGAIDQARYATLVFTTSTGANFAVYAPPASKLYVIYNASAYVATIYNSSALGNTTAGGVGIDIPAGKLMTVVSDGANFYQQNTHLTSPTITTGSLTTPTLTTPRVITAINDTNGNELIAVTATASAVNEITVANAATAGKPTISATGGDANITLNLVSKGTGTVQVGGVDVVTTTGTQTLTNKTLTTPKIGTSIDDTNGNELIKFSPTASAVNEITLANAATLGKPTITATGSDADISLNLVPKGAGKIQVGGLEVVALSGSQTLTDKTLSSPAITTPAITTGLNDANGLGWIAVTAAASAVNYVTVANAATAGTPSITATGSDANINLNLVPKGTGKVQVGGLEVVALSGAQTLADKTLTSPILTTPALGTPSSGTLTNCSFPTLNQSTTGSSGSVVTTGFSIVEAGGYLYFKSGATNIARLDSSGNFVALGVVTAGGTI